MLKYLILSITLFVIGLLGLFLSKRHFLIILISFELILLSINLNFLIFSFFLNDLLGQMYILLNLTIAASELAIGLAIVVAVYRLKGSLIVDLVKLLKS
jgi:NADH-quinone oxidoreductase subunit K